MLLNLQNEDLRSFNNSFWSISSSMKWKQGRDEIGLIPRGESSPFLYCANQSDSLRRVFLQQVPTEVRKSGENRALQQKGSSYVKRREAFNNLPYWLGKLILTSRLQEMNSMIDPIPLLQQSGLAHTAGRMLKASKLWHVPGWLKRHRDVWSKWLWGEVSPLVQWKLSKPQCLIPTAPNHWHLGWLLVIREPKITKSKKIHHPCFFWSVWHPSSGKVVLSSRVHTYEAAQSLVECRSSIHDIWR